MSSDDTVKVRLSQAGKDAAQGGTLRVHGGGSDLSFKGDDVQDVHLTAWHEVLKPSMIGGKPAFEIALPATTVRPIAVGPAKSNGPAQ